MKIKLLLFFLLLTTTLIWSQETPETGIQRVTEELNALIKSNKDSLQTQLNNIDLQLQKNEITPEEAANLKKEANENYATTLDDILVEKIDAIWNKKLEIDEAVFGPYSEEEYDEIVELAEEQDSVPSDVNLPKSLKKLKAPKYKSSFMLAFGLNNTVVDNDLGSLEDSPYSYKGSNFFEVAFLKNIPFSKSSDLFKFKYGLNFKYAELKLFDNLYHFDSGETTSIITHAEQLKKSKLTTSQILIPLELELSTSKKGDDDLTKTKTGFRLGIGGYAGVNYYTKEVIKFKDAELRKQDNYGNFNVNPFVYGLSANIGYGHFSLYTKYDLSSFYKEGNSNNISAGLRIEM